MTTLTLDRKTASEYDYVVAIDRSGSMNRPVGNGNNKSRWEHAQETTIGIGGALSRIDTNGIDVITFGGDASNPNSVKLYEGQTVDKIVDIFNNEEPGGGTPTDKMITLVADRQRQSGKKCLCVVLTDGEPTNPDATCRTIANVTQKMENDDQLTFLFVQVGDDETATRFLKKLDDELVSQYKAKHDIVDTVSLEQAGSMTAVELIAKAIND